jgi:hypothetical protein
MAEEPSSLPEQVTWEEISATHPEYDGAYLERLRAFYKGGKALLRNHALMEEVFPKHNDESPGVYKERCRRAFYLPYAGEILNFIKASLSAEQLRMDLSKEKGAKEGPPTPEWYSEWFKDVSPPGGKSISMHDFVREAILEGLICRVAWARTDLPAPPSPSEEYKNLATQEKAGALEAYALIVPAESVIDWDEDESGELELVVVHSRSRKRTGLKGGRSIVIERFLVYTREEWAIYELPHKVNEHPSPQIVVRRVKGGKHTFGRVPFARLDVGDGLWAMDNIESACRALFESLSGRAWAEFQSLHQELYEFLGPEESSAGVQIGENQQDAERAVKQKRGQGHVQVRGKDDEAKFVGPSNAPFEEARKSCSELRAEIHRVTHQMALAADNTAAALRRSADSKGHDKASAVVVFTALGQIARKFAEDLTNLVSRGRSDVALVDKWAASGMAKFDAISVDASITRAVELSSVPIPSPTFWKLYYMALAKDVLGEEVDEEELDSIEDELEENVTAESITKSPTRPGLPPLPKVTDDIPKEPVEGAPDAA